MSLGLWSPGDVPSDIAVVPSGDVVVHLKEELLPVQTLLSRGGNELFSLSADDLVSRLSKLQEREVGWGSMRELLFSSHCADIPSPRSLSAGRSGGARKQYEYTGPENAYPFHFIFRVLLFAMDVDGVHPVLTVAKRVCGTFCRLI